MPAGPPVPRMMLAALKRTKAGRRPRLRRASRASAPITFFPAPRPAVSKAITGWPSKTRIRFFRSSKVRARHIIRDVSGPADVALRRESWSVL